MSLVLLVYKHLETVLIKILKFLIGKVLKEVETGKKN